MLVLGGVRSGKSAWAEARLGGSRVNYVATAANRPGDADWAARIAAHRRRRPGSWTTTETSGDPTLLPAALRSAGPETALLIDDVGNWLTSALDAAHAWDHPEGALAAEGAVADLITSAAACQAPLVLVSPEVGLGVVPATRSGRVFADAQGALNQRLAALCDEVVLVVAGLPMRLK